MQFVELDLTNSLNLLVFLDSFGNHKGRLGLGLGFTRLSSADNYQRDTFKRNTSTNGTTFEIAVGAEATIPLAAARGLGARLSKTS